MPRCRVRAERIWTGDVAHPVARSIVVHDGRIESLEGMQASRELDGGPWVGPAFIDAHLHMTLGGLTLAELDLSTAGSRQVFEEAVTGAHARLAPDRWLKAHGWDQSRWGGDMPTMAWLSGCGERPAIAWRMDQHACVVNQAAMRRIQARHDLRSDPPGGRVERNAQGEPTGLFLEQAAWKWVKPFVPEPTVQERREGLRAAGRFLASHGIATVGSMEYARDLVEAIEPLRRELPVRVRATLLDRDWPLDWNLANCISRDEGLAIIGFKAFVDGTLGSRTARMLEPWSDARDHSGLFMELAERGVLGEWLREGLRRDFSMSLHVIGDAAIRAALDAADAAEFRGTPARESLRLEHAQTVHPLDIARMHGRWASMQPLHKAFDGPGAPAALGPARMDRFFPFRSLQEAGARLAFGSDWPIVSPDPLAGMRAAITGMDIHGDPCRPQENLFPDAALAAYTLDAARCLRCNGRTGRVAAGLSADLVSLDRDPFRCNWITDPPKVRWCMHAGEITFAG